jgi:hypothetical protein
MVAEARPAADHWRARRHALGLRAVDRNRRWFVRYKLVRRLGGLLALAVLVCPLLGSRVPTVAREPKLAVSPNPAHTLALFTVQVPVQQRIAIGVYDLAGRLLRTIDPWVIGSGEPDGFVPAGIYHFEWDLRDAEGARVHPGLYFVRLTAESGVKKARVAVLQ